MSLWNHLVCRPSLIKMHFKCRNAEIPYLNSTIKRLLVPDEKVNWSSEWSSYQATDYTDPSTNGKPWADNDDLSAMRFNALDGAVNRKSHQVDYAFDVNGRPLNPMGRTGLSGRGILGRWGPNHAADPIVSRFKDGRLQFVAIKRKDTGEWAIPGGMVDPGEQVSATLKREFGEEALGGKAAQMEKVWGNGKQIYAGYVDDPRNTDNAWMETVVVNFHDSDGIMNDVKLEAGDDAASVRWVFVDANESLYASHQEFINLLKKAHCI
ncbi:hypothetical protein PFISCL1PPCAC_6074 [Pristionchus fissidentatus]|uniref:Nudix hydrolase domain-containing protein n=1 Tax=Pristionchus fissidentatus TaxID=1538716 RepID=A0AAV5V7Q8_9BILA|nr:hypothetical protein PFISCL1PPCAC_6074 [Pristionchus fissidentatus]